MPLTHVVKDHRVHVKGTCQSFPCAVGKWRCPECTSLLVAAYQGIVLGLHEKMRSDCEEKEASNRQSNEMRVVVDAANAQLPVLQARTLAAEEAAKEARTDAETYKLRMKDLEAQLELAKADTIADRLKDALAELSRLRTELAEVRHRLGKETLAAHEAKRQQCLGAADVRNYRGYIRSARAREATVRSEMQRMQKRLSAMGMEMNKKDDVTSEMQARIEELTGMSSEAIRHQDDMRHQNEGLVNVVTELVNALETAAETEASLRAKAQMLQKANTQAHEQIAQMNSMMSYQRNASQSTKNILAREKALRKKAEFQATVTSSSTGVKGGGGSPRGKEPNNAPSKATSRAGEAVEEQNI